MFVMRVCNVGWGKHFNKCADYMEELGLEVINEYDLLKAKKLLETGEYGIFMDAYNILYFNLEGIGVGKKIAYMHENDSSKRPDYILYQSKVASMVLGGNGHIVGAPVDYSVFEKYKFSEKLFDYIVTTRVLEWKWFWEKPIYFEKFLRVVERYDNDNNMFTTCNLKTKRLIEKYINNATVKYLNDDKYMETLAQSKYFVVWEDKNMQEFFGYRFIEAKALGLDILIEDDLVSTDVKMCAKTINNQWKEFDYKKVAKKIVDYGERVMEK